MNHKALNRFADLLVPICLSISVIACTAPNTNERKTSQPTAVETLNSPAKPPGVIETPGAGTPPGERHTQPSPPTPTTKSYSDLVAEAVTEAMAGGYRSLRTGGLQAGSWNESPWCETGLACTPFFLNIVINPSRYAPGASGSCSGVRLASDLALTNRHCVATISQTANTSFGSGSMILQEPGPSPTQRLGGIAFVDNIIAMSPAVLPSGPLGTADWALLKISSHPHLQLDGWGAHPVPEQNRQGIVDGETYFVYSKSPFATDDPSTRGAVQKQPCQALYQTIFAANFSAPSDAVIALADCPIGPGNSGAPIYDRNNRLVGIIGGQINQALWRAVSTIAREYLGTLKDPRGFANVGWGVNLACVPDLDHPGRPISKMCDRQFGVPNYTLEASPELSREAIQKLEADAQTAGNFEFKSQPSHISDSNMKILAQGLFVRVPECVSRETLNPITFDPIRFPLRFVGVELNRLGKMTDHLIDVQTHAAILELDHAKLIRDGSVAAQVKLADSGLLMHEGTVRICAQR